MARPLLLLVLTVAIIAMLAGAGVSYLVGNVNKHTTTSQPYRVEFVQESNCPYGSWLVPWAVVINHQTVAQPPNAPLPLSYSSSRLTGNSTYSTIWFSLPNGTYTYSILPSNMNDQEQSGNVTVDGSDVVVQVFAYATSMGCSSTTTT